MSYRSALASPSTNSGNVGLVITGVNPIGAIPIPNSSNRTYTTIDTITLTDGLWNISISHQNILSGFRVNWVIVEIIVVNGLSPATILFNTTLQAYTNNTSVTGTFSYSNDVLVNLTETSVVSLNITQYNNSGTLNVINPVTLSGEYITATKLA